jgi:urease accessory protein
MRTATSIIITATASVTLTAACRATRITATTMAERSGPAAILRLSAWLSPAFPVGSFSYSHGLERAVHDGLVRDADGLRDWLAALIGFGSGWNDAVLFCEAMRRAEAGDDCGELAELAEALAGAAERHMESCLQGRAFAEAAAAWSPDLARLLPENCPYPVAVGAFAGAAGIAPVEAAAVYLQAFASNLVQAAIRLGVLGQSDGVRLIAGLEPLLSATAARAADTALDDLGSCTMLAEIAAMRHETQHSRLFRT